MGCLFAFACSAVSSRLLARVAFERAVLLTFFPTPSSPDTAPIWAAILHCIMSKAPGPVVYQVPLAGFPDIGNFGP